ncbi:fungal-specific transcription factor domain-containing protein [Aspergillus leporis]|uniref:Fungal-specific transcription factor domain-containing protein n=1 Tax=Aspergillus leporis TaxID=41062 RepID=A0A5N5XFX6_9EURO|nr:fungal-specific transcription factor domain-containing protein [Aspergillus leporis]
MPPNKRPRTEPIVRVRTGCYTCRRRKKKCDEVRPFCGGCVRNNLNCEWPANVPANSTTRSDGPSTMVQQAGPDEANSPSTARTHRDSSGSPRSPSGSPSGSVVSPPAMSSGFDAAERFSPPTDEQTLPAPIDFHHVTPRSSISEPESPASMTVGNFMPRSLSMLPGYSPESFQLLSHYLATTADVMANGSTPVNPFLVQIVPLAFSSDLLLQLVLTQSAAHRAFRCRNDSDEVAQSHYTKALQLFRKGVTEFIDGKESNPLMLTVGALVMCFTETAKGDMNGTIFDHLSAANSLLTRLLSLSDAAVPKDLKDFVIEYYTYTAAVSMISIDARVSHQLLLNFDLEQKARQLLQSEYVGNLCGCWLELLLLIPCIFDLGRQWMMLDGQPSVPTADDIAMFGSLQAQIMRWDPFSFVTPEVFLAGRVFQQAMLLYLYTSLGSFSRAEDGMHQGLINTAITEAMSYLSQLSATARINSGLCWPIAVVGSCLFDVEQQDQLRRRLTTMVNTFGLGNMQRTLLLLENMWQMPLDEAGPWNICRAMQQHQIWISFA